MAVFIVHSCILEDQDNNNIDLLFISTLLVAMAMKRKVSELSALSNTDQTPFSVPDLVQLIFIYVGPEDAIWNCRKVCKEWNNLTQSV